MLSKNCTISSTKWENQHYFETFSALTLKIRTCCSKFEFKTGTCVQSTSSRSKSTLIMTASHGDILVQGSPTAQKEHARFCRSTTWWSYRATPCNLSKGWRSVHFFQWNESEHVVLPIIIIWHSVCWISGALNEHYLKFWALNRALNAEKQGTLKALNPNFTSTKLSALVRVTAIIVIAHAELLLVGQSWGRSLHCRACAVTMTTHNCKTRVCVSVSVCIYCTCMCFGGDHQIQTGVNQRLEVEITASKRSPCHFTSDCFREVCWVAFESSKERGPTRKRKRNSVVTLPVHNWEESSCPSWKSCKVEEIPRDRLSIPSLSADQEEEEDLSGFVLGKGETPSPTVQLGCHLERNVSQSTSGCSRPV